MDGVDSGELTTVERDRLMALRSARSLEDLVELTDVDSEHDAYVEAKAEWSDLRGKELAGESTNSGLPGNTVEIDGHAFHVHGVTHADTDAEGRYLRTHVSDVIDSGAFVYCEQGIRSMYFGDFERVCAMDDYRWAMRQCQRLDIDSHVDGLADDFEGVVEDVDSLTGEFREATFSLIDSGSDAYGERVRQALGDVASAFLTTHESMATGEDFESFTKNRLAAENPERLVDLQHYYERRFLPQPIEREWLRRHDRELELVTHARNERMADYVVHHNEDVESVHVIVGAAHQPGVTYYLQRIRDGERSVDFEPIE